MIAGVPEVALMMSSISLPWEDSEVVDWIKQSKVQEQLGFRLGICLQNGTLIGSVGIRPNNYIGYFIGRDHWVQGFVSEALKLFLGWVFSKFSIDQIDAEILDENPASSAVLVKFGFVSIGQSTCKSMARVEAEASTLYRLTRDAFEGRYEVS